MDSSCQALAAKYTRRQAKQLEDQLDGVGRADDIEFVHRARVASRRLRTALKMFHDCFPRRQVKRWRKQIRRVTSELSDARDKDVQIERVCRTLEAADQSSYYPGLARLLVHLERQRELLQSGVVAATQRLRRSKVLEEMQAAAKHILAGLSTEELASQRAAARISTAQHVRRCLDRLRACQDSLLDSEAKQQHHAMRIAAKRLRYTLEIANPIYEKGLAPFIESAKKVQTLLGEIHDCDVWLEHLDAFAADQRKGILTHFGNDAPFARLEVGIEYLRQDRRAHRRAIFHELIEYWEELHQQRCWDHLLSFLKKAAANDRLQSPPAEAIGCKEIASASPKPTEDPHPPTQSPSPPPQPIPEQFIRMTAP
jgi:CHAD domain-containing protein